jgi:hypothetical protein
VNFPVRAVMLLVCGVALTGCASPMGQREAEVRANRSLTSFCREKACGPAKLIRAQKLKTRWLVDFETPAGLYTVMVDQGGNTQVSVWDKNPAPTR